MYAPSESHMVESVAQKFGRYCMIDEVDHCFSMRRLSSGITNTASILANRDDLPTSCTRGGVHAARKLHGIDDAVFLYARSSGKNHQS